MNIAELDKRALLVSLTIPTVQSVSTVRDTTRRVVAEENASRAAVRVVAAKLPTARAAAVQSRLDAVRSLHTALTLPFIGQFRLLRAETYLDYLSKVQSALIIAGDEVSAQFGDRGEVLAAVAKQMGDIPYDVGQIPTEQQLMKRIMVTPMFLPITSMFGAGMTDKLGISEEELALMNTVQTQLVDKVAADSTMAVVAEVVAAVTRVVESLVKYDMDKPEFNEEGKRTRRSGFHATMITNLTDLADRLPALDLTTEQRLTTLAIPLRIMARFDTDTLKDSETARSTILKEAMELLGDLGGHVAEDFGSDEMFGGLL